MRRSSKLLATLALLICLLAPLSAPIVYAQDVTNQIQNGLCAGSNLNLTSNPNSGECAKTSGIEKINKETRRLVNLLSVMVGVIAVVMIIIGGLRYVTSGGSDSSITGARNTILYALIGLIIVALAQVLVHFVLNSLT